MTIIAAADGSALGNPGPAGWAWYVDETCWASGGWDHGTNNMGELMAVLDLLQQTAHLDDDLEVLCDSQYVINAVTKWIPGWKRRGWKKGDGKPVLNVELMKGLDAALTARKEAGRKIRFEWVKGHAGHELNEAADLRARNAATALQEGRTPDSGPGFAGSSTNHPVATPKQSEPEPDLFSAAAGAEVLDAQSRETVTDFELITRAERDLLTDEVRSDPSRMAALLHPDFTEIGASGRLWTRAEVLSEIGALPTPTELQVVSSRWIDTDSILLLWRAVSDQQTRLRSSVWVREKGNWLLLFCQGTPV